MGEIPRGQPGLIISRGQPGVSQGHAHTEFIQGSPRYQLGLSSARCRAWVSQGYEFRSVSLESSGISCFSYI